MFARVLFAANAQLFVPGAVHLVEITLDVGLFALCLRFVSVYVFP